jgi:transposase-like protein
MDELVAGPMTPESVQDLSMAFKKALIERALGAEMVHHLGYAAGTDRGCQKFCVWALPQ